MAKQKNNIIMRSTRGMVGKQIVFKRRAGKGYVAAPPEVNENRTPTDGQALGQTRFKRSAQYAKLAIASPELKKAYEKVAKRGQSAYNVAFADAFTAPEVRSIVATAYTGLPGSVILVSAADDFKVNLVKVSISNSLGELIEEGTATSNNDGVSWTYTATQSNPSLAGTIIRATAMDIPENEGSLEVTV